MIKTFSIGAIIGAVVIFLCMRSCNKNLQQINRAAKDTIMVRDTALVIKFKKDSAAASDSIRYLLSVINRVQDKADIKEVDFNNKLAQSDFTNRKLKTALEAHDITVTMALCAALQVQYETTRSAGFAFKHERDSLLQLWPQVHLVDSLALKSCHIDFNAEHTNLNNISGLYDKTDSLLTRALNKRFSVGPFVGVTYTNSFKPIYGIGISYQLFKF